ncbi:MAG: hypothetical protein R2856_00665 [Caldilineaceae bacterium]
MTNDFNLTWWRIQGVQVQHQRTGQCRQPVVLPGEELGIKVIQEGKEINQGVGY